ncbi:MAG TPA: hypothetical protein VFX35_04500 [Solirubrobacterales bacterium]|nr:hypothetical protein [Solirubrobacterales bacterium]
MAVSDENKKILMAELLRIGEETKEFDYIPSRYLQDVANSDPAELVLRYVLAKEMTDGFERLWREKRLDLTVENLAWKHRAMFPPKVGREARARLEAVGFDVRTQKQEG